MKSESYIENKCKKYAESMGYNVRKVQFIAVSGCPDRFFFKKGHSFFVEFKAVGGKTSKLQDYNIKLMRDAGLEVHIIDNIENFKEIVK